MRKKKKVVKYRGSTTHGCGSKKKRRGYGHKGGRGLAGSCKHLWTQIVKNKKRHFGKRGFRRHASLVEKDVVVNLGFIENNFEELSKKNVIINKDGKLIVDIQKLGFTKLLGGGKVKHPFFVKTPKFSQKAKAKLEAVSGGII